MFCRWRTITPAPAIAAKTTVCHGSPNSAATTGNAIAVTIEARDEYRVRRKVTAQMARHRVATSGASASVTPPAVATVLPPFWKRRNSGRQWPSIAAAPARMPTVSPPIRTPATVGTKPSRRRGARPGSRSPARTHARRSSRRRCRCRACGCLRGGGRGRASSRTVSSRRDSRRHSTRTSVMSSCRLVPASGGGNRYASTHPLTTSQSRLPKNASM